MIERYQKNFISVNPADCIAEIPSQDHAPIHGVYREDDRFAGRSIPHHDESPAEAQWKEQEWDRAARGKQ